MMTCMLVINYRTAYYSYEIREFAVKSPYGSCDGDVNCIASSIQDAIL